MRTSETQGDLLSALFEARKLYPKIAKTKQGQSGNRTFMYAPMEDILDAIEAINFANGLLITQPVDGNSIITRLDHVESGEWRETSMPVNAEHANMQSYGIELTYRKRYAIQGMLGIITEEDTDGAGAKEKRNGVDHTRNANGTAKGPGIPNARQAAFEILQPEIQDALRKAAPQVEAAMPDAKKALDVATMAVEQWGEFAEDAKAGLSYLLSSKTKNALKREAQVSSLRRAA
jgi:hypothetical protein